MISLSGLSAKQRLAITAKIAGHGCDVVRAQHRIGLANTAEMHIIIAVRLPQPEDPKAIQVCKLLSDVSADQVAPHWLTPERRVLLEAELEAIGRTGLAQRGTHYSECCTVVINNISTHWADPLPADCAVVICAGPDPKAADTLARYLFDNLRQTVEQQQKA